MRINQLGLWAAFTCLLVGGLADAQPSRVETTVTGVGAPAIADAEAEVYDPDSGTFASTKDGSQCLSYQTLTEIKPGLALSVGRGCPTGAILHSASDANSFSPRVPLNTQLSGHSATLLNDGDVLVAGGYGGNGCCDRGLRLDQGTMGGPISADWKAGPWGGWIFSAATIYEPVADAFVFIGNMGKPRFGHAAALLKNGQVLITGGFTGDSLTNTAELFDPVTRQFHATGSMHEPRIGHTASLLNDGSVLVAGGFNGTRFSASAELYDPKLKSFQPTRQMKTAREGATATLLRNGMVLITGGHNQGGVTTSCELFDAQKSVFRSTAEMIHPRYSHCATLLSSGKVLLAGGDLAITPLTRAGEVFDPATLTFSGVTSLAGIPDPSTDADGESYYTWTKLSDGRIFHVYSPSYSEHAPPGQPAVIAEIEDPKTERSSLAAEMKVMRQDATVTLLADDRVLVAGGLPVTPPLHAAVAEIYDPRSNRFIMTGRMMEPRSSHAAVRLHDGRVLIVGGIGGPVPVSNSSDEFQMGPALATAEVYDPATAEFRRTGSMATARVNARVALLNDGRVLVVGGTDAQGQLRRSSAEAYDPKTGRFSAAGQMMTSISPDIAITLTSGAVLILGDPQL
ncbi:MAG TPA: kelch repeat-containing protein [Candidatus Binataceae bacterium]